MYFKKQKSENVLSRNDLSLCCGSGGHSKQFSFPASKASVLFGLNFNQLSNTSPAISDLDLVIISSTTNLVSLQLLVYIGTLGEK